MKAFKVLTLVQTNLTLLKPGWLFSQVATGVESVRVNTKKVHWTKPGMGRLLSTCRCVVPPCRNGHITIFFGTQLGLKPSGSPGIETYRIITDSDFLFHKSRFLWSCNFYGVYGWMTIVFVMGASLSSSMWPSLLYVSCDSAFLIPKEKVYIKCKERHRA